MSGAQEEFNDLMRDKERRTGHPQDDDDDARSFLNLSDDEDDDTTPGASTADPDEALARPSISLARNTIPLTRYQANTGPKGVISDAQNFRDSRRSHRLSIRSTSTLPSQATDRVSPNDQILSEKIDESDEDDDLDEDGDFMRKWRKSRLREMRRGARDSKLHNRNRSTRLFGGLTTVDGNGYLDALEKSPADTVVVVYIYDDYVSLSALLSTIHLIANATSVASEHCDRRLYTNIGAEASRRSIHKATLSRRRNGACRSPSTAGV